MKTSRRAIRAELTAQRRGFGGRLSAIDHQQTELRERIAYLEGLLEGLREAITIWRGAA